MESSGQYGRSALIVSAELQAAWEPPATEQVIEQPADAPPALEQSIEPAPAQPDPPAPVQPVDLAAYEAMRQAQSRALATRTGSLLGVTDDPAGAEDQIMHRDTDRHLARLHRATERYETAVARSRRGLDSARTHVPRFDPKDAAAYELATRFDRATFDPKNPKQLEDAVAVCQLAIGMRPDWAEAHALLGDARMFQGRLDEAIDAYQRALALRPNLIEPLRLMGSALMHRGQTDEAVAAYRRLLRLQPNHLEASNNLLFIAHYHPDYDAQTLLDLHRRWARRFADPLAREIRPHQNDRAPDRRLKIGFVGRCFAEGMQGQCILALSLDRDRHRIELFAVSVRQTTSFSRTAGAR